VQVGLSYEAIVQQMRLEAGVAEGTAQGKYQRITNVAVRLYQCGKGLLIGPTDTDADMEPVQVNDGQAIADSQLIDGDTDIISFPEGYSQTARVTLKHNEPLPCSVIAIMPNLTVETS
jgi:hypothetical protein